MKQLFVYSAQVKKVIDGDTIDFTVDLGFNTYVAIRTRLMGINAPELSEEAGKAAKAFVQKELPVGSPVIIETHKHPGDKYGRWLAVVHVADDRGNTHNVNTRIVFSGHAVAYMT